MSKNVALVLSSGSSRGLVHIGAIEALEECGYTITSIAGCSMGSLVGGMYAAGKLPELKQFFLGMDLLHMLQVTDFSLSKNHLIKGDKLMERFGEMIPNVNIEDLPIPYVLIATDFERGEEKVFRSGNLNQLIRASISIPVVFRPVSYQDMLLTDGGTCNPLPLNRVKRTPNDILVSINVNAPIKQAQHKTPQDTSFIRIIDHLIEKHYHKAFGGVLEKLLYEKEHSLVKFFNELAEKDMPLAELNYLNIINRITDIMLVQNSQLMKQLCPADMSVDIPNNRWGRYDYDHAQEIIEYGYQTMKAEIERFEKQAIK